MNNKYIRLTLISIASLLLVSISGCSQIRAPHHVQQQHSKAPVYAPHAQSRHASRSVNSGNTSNTEGHRIHGKLGATQQYPVSSSFHARKRMIDVAHQSLGTRYRYGGRTPKGGFDCSGLMHYVHKSLGIDIPRTAAQQRDRSRTINYAQLQPGDMLFFKTGKRTNHVGVYIGNRKFIHASTGTRRVIVAKMDSKYWHQRFVKFGTFL